MLELLKNFVAEIGSGEKHGTHFDAGDYRLAAAALLIHVVGIDGNVSAVEREKLHTVLKSQFELDDARTAELIDAATAADRDAVDLRQAVRGCLNAAHGSKYGLSAAQVLQ